MDVFQGRRAKAKSPRHLVLGVVGKAPKYLMTDESSRKSMLPAQRLQVFAASVTNINVSCLQFVSIFARRERSLRRFTIHDLRFETKKARGRALGGHRPRCLGEKSGANPWPRRMKWESLVPDGSEKEQFRAVIRF